MLQSRFGSVLISHIMPLATLISLPEWNPTLMAKVNLSNYNYHGIQPLYGQPTSFPSIDSNMDIRIVKLSQFQTNISTNGTNVGCAKSHGHMETTRMDTLRSLVRGMNATCILPEMAKPLSKSKTRKKLSERWGLLKIVKNHRHLVTTWPRRHFQWSV